MGKEVVQRVMLVVGGGIVLLGYVQLALYPDLRNLIYLGWDDHYYRMVSTFLDPNFVGIFFVLYLFYLITHGKQLLSSKKVYGFLLTGISLLTFLAIFLTYSRTAILALFAGSFIYLFMIKKVRYILVIIVIGSIIFLGLANTKYESLNPLRTASISARMIAGEKAITIIVQNPILGVGYNTYRYALKQNNFSSNPRFPQHGEAGTDNSLLFVTATTGVVGLLVFLYLWGRTIYLYRRNVLLVTSIIVWFVGSIFINTLFYPFLLLWVISLIIVIPNSAQ